MLVPDLVDRPTIRLCIFLVESFFDKSLCIFRSPAHKVSKKKRKKKLKNHTNIEGKEKKNEKKFLTLGYNENEVDWKGITLG